jgi:type II secretion system protein J
MTVLKRHFIRRSSHNEVGFIRRSSYNEVGSKFHDDGFTLIEILSATLISALLLGSLYAVFHGALKLRDKDYGIMEKGLPRAYVTEIMDRDFRNMAPPVGILAGAVIGETNKENDLRRDRVEFYTSTGVLTDKENWGDVQKVEYYLLDPEENDKGEKGQGLDFVRAVTRNLLASIAQEPEETRLLNGVKSLEITYFDGEVWQDSWDSTGLDNASPKAVRIRIEFETAADGEENISPLELLIEVAASAVTSQGGTNASGS